MKTDRIKQYISYLLLTVFLTMKMVGLHELTHADDLDDQTMHCVICDHAITHNLTPVLAPDFQDFNINIPEVLTPSAPVKAYAFISTNSIATNQLFSRPPPKL